MAFVDKLKKVTNHNKKAFNITLNAQNITTYKVDWSIFKDKRLEEKQ